MSFVEAVGSRMTSEALDPVLTILKVREMLCIAVYLIQAVGPENYSVACFPLVILDSTAETLALSQNCWHCLVHRRNCFRHSVDQHLGHCLSNCFPFHPCSVAVRTTRHGAKHLQQQKMIVALSEHMCRSCLLT
jgi:hypothetical protein